MKCTGRGESCDCLELYGGFPVREQLVGCWILISNLLGATATVCCATAARSWHLPPSYFNILFYGLTYSTVLLCNINAVEGMHKGKTFIKWWLRSTGSNLKLK